jgi:hypothetical protein
LGWAGWGTKHRVCGMKWAAVSGAGMEDSLCGCVRVCVVFVWAVRTCGSKAPPPFSSSSISLIRFSAWRTHTRTHTRQTTREPPRAKPPIASTTTVTHTHTDRQAHTSTSAQPHPQAPTHLADPVVPLEVGQGGGVLVGVQEVVVVQRGDVLHDALLMPRHGHGVRRASAPAPHDHAFPSYCVREKVWGSSNNTTSHKR